MEIDDTIRRFLLALHTAEYIGQSTNIHAIPFAEEETALSVFKRCKAEFLVMGDPSAAWVTPAGRKVIGVKQV